MSPIPGGSDFLNETFEDGEAQQWVAESGQWRVGIDNVNALYQGSDAGYVRFGENYWQNYALEFRTRFISTGATSRIYVQAYVDSTTTTEPKIILVLDYDAALIRLFEIPRNGGINEIGSINYTFKPQQWVNIRIENIDENIRIVVNDAARITAKISTANHKGFVRFGLSQATVAQFDDVHVWALAEVVGPTPTPLPTPTATLIPPEKRLEAENFDDGAAENWSVDSGLWGAAFDGSNVVYQGSGNGYIRLGEDFWRGYAIEFRTRFIKTDRESRIFIQTHVDSGGRNEPKVILVLDYDTKQLRLFEFSQDGNLTELRSINYTFQTAQWMKIKIQILDKSIQVYVDGRSRIRLNLADSNHHGFVRFGVSNNTVAQFDDVLIWPSGE